jgi:two-component sensor histidine kinase
LFNSNKTVLDIYYKKKRWKQSLLLFAIFIGIGSLLFTNKLVNEASKEERTKIKHWAEATRLLVTEDNLNEDVFNFLFQIPEDNTTIPLIIVDENNKITTDGNIKYSPKNREKVLYKELARMKSRQKPIIIPLGENENHYLYYSESSLQTQLRYYPFFQLGVIVIFIIAAYVTFSTARKSEQNLVWIGMAKETAHQLGTPISSLMAWIELLKEEKINPIIITELSKDSKRLEKITERFSKIGSHPELFPENLYQQLLNTINYLQTRISKKITITYNFSDTKELYLPLSSSLFSWVIENLVRNSVDALEDNVGEINIDVQEKENEVIIEVTDNGKGIPKSKFKTIFNPGFTSKKRGWGLGLSLSKRIIEIYHKGKIAIKSSTPKKATTFRILLKK